MHVVATAGHVDHGKSTLVAALTGQNPDRLEEERRRGLSIELGYCWTSLPGVGEVAFVDVPGHERFIATTLAGLGPSPVAMLVVAADDPWMPQAAEHLAALDALAVRHAVLVISRADLADPEPALARARSEIAGTSLASAPAVVVSGRTGAGLDRLRLLLVEVLTRVPPADTAAPARLWVDRRFHVRGSGTVVTGTLVSGTVAVGDVLRCGPDTVRVRAVEALGARRERMGAVARVALDLGGRAPASVTRGSALLSPDAFLSTPTVDVRLAGAGRVPDSPVLHLGSALVATRSRPLGEGMWRLTLERPLPLRVGDRGVLRDPGSRALWGVEVLDPLPQPLRRRGAAAARASDLAALDGSAAQELATRTVVRRSLLLRAGARIDRLPSGTVTAGDWLIGPDHATALRARLVDLVVRAEARGADGVAPAAAARSLGLPDPALVDALVAHPLRAERGRVTTGTPPGLAPALVEALDALAADLEGRPFSAPDTSRLARLGLDESTVALLHRRGHVLRLAPGVVLLPEAAAAAVGTLRGVPQPFTVSDARRALATSRRVTLPLLGHLDATGWTVRLPDDRRRIRERP